MHSANLSRGCILESRRFISCSFLKPSRPLSRIAGGLAITPLFVAAAVACFAEGSGSATEPSETAAKDEAARRPSGPYCGVYCVSSLLNAYGKSCDIRDLIGPQYISQRLGSSLDDLQRAAEDFGLQAVVMKDLTVADLRKMSWPCILHVRPAKDVKEYRHFIIYLGAGPDGTARVYDPPQPLTSMPFHELALLWDGRGMIVSDAPIDVAAVVWAARKRYAFYAGIAVAAVLAAYYVRKRWAHRPTPARWRVPLIRPSHVQAIGLCALGGIIAFSYHYTSDMGLLAHRDATASVVDLYKGTFVPKVGQAKLRRMLDAGRVVVVDARNPRDYQQKHIEEAISVPIGSSSEERSAALANVPKNAKVVVYCQSANCKFAEIIGAELVSDGFQKVSILKGGWVEWAANGS